MSRRRRQAKGYVLGLLNDDSALGRAALAPRELSPAPDPLFARILSDIVDQTPVEPWRHDRPGVAVRPIWNSSTFLIRCARGTCFPAHDHPQEERMVVLDGEVMIGGRRFSTGAVEVGVPGARHDAGVALQDCLVLIQYG